MIGEIICGIELIRHVYFLLSMTYKHGEDFFYYVWALKTFFIKIIKIYQTFLNKKSDDTKIVFLFTSGGRSFFFLMMIGEVIPEIEVLPFMSTLFLPRSVVKKSRHGRPGYGRMRSLKNNILHLRYFLEPLVTYFFKNKNIYIRILWAKKICTYTRM